MKPFRARPTVPRIEAGGGRTRDGGEPRPVRQTPAPNRHRVTPPLIGDYAPSLHLVGRVFFPFAAGYFLSYLFRTISALIAAPLSAEFALTSGSLGLLTSAYFLTFAAAQLPVGVLLDCYGPRRVQSVLLLIAAAGAALFAMSDGVLSLFIGRALIGLGVAAALTAGLKATVLWFSKDRVPLVNGCMVMLGALGAVTATAPSEWLLGWIGWRGLFELFAIATAWSAGMIYLLVPETSPPTMPSAGHAFAGLKTIYADPRFWRLAPLSATTIGTAWALQGLWAASWLSDVDGLRRAAIVHYLLAMAVALSVGALLLGIATDRLRRCYAGSQSFFGGVTALFMTVQLALILRWPLPPYVLWCIVAMAGAATILSYAIVAEYYPKELAGRANGALNVFHIGGAFVLQDLTGVVIQHWPAQGGHYPIIAYQAAFAINLALQVAAWIWFLWPSVRAAATDALRRYLVVGLASP